MRFIWIVLIAFTFAFLAPGKLSICVFTRRSKFLSLDILLFCVEAFKNGADGSGGNWRQLERVPFD